MRILVINSGSSSIKYWLFDMPKEKTLTKGLIERIGERTSKIKNHHEGIQAILKNIRLVSAVGHRVVHGAEEFRKPALINRKIIKKIRNCFALAPLHNPANLAGIKACNRLLKAIPQVAVFDTAFHQTLPEFAYIYGLPYRFYKKFGIRRYGFHGTSHEYVAQEAAKRLRKPLKKLRLISCHLGNGCSIAAIKFGESIDTSMGFTPLEGLVMGTRCGDIDPAIVTFLQRKMKVDSDKIDNILNRYSGLKGISGLSNDMREIIKKARQGNRRAKLAKEIFIYRIKKYIGSYIAILGGLDALIFTAGIGENQDKIRRAICQGLFSFMKKKPRILVIPTDEERMIARQTYRVIKRDRGVKIRC